MINITRCGNCIRIVSLAHDICFALCVGWLLWIANCYLGWNYRHGFVRSWMVSSWIITLLLLNFQIIRFSMFTRLDALLLEIKRKFHSDRVMIIWIHFWALFLDVLGEELIVYMSPRVVLVEYHGLKTVDFFMINFLQLHHWSVPLFKLYFFEAIVLLFWRHLAIILIRFTFFRICIILNRLCLHSVFACVYYLFVQTSILQWVTQSKENILFIFFMVFVQ